MPSDIFIEPPSDQIYREERILEALQNDWYTLAYVREASPIIVESTQTMLKYMNFHLQQKVLDKEKNFALLEGIVNSTEYKELEQLRTYLYNSIGSEYKSFMTGSTRYFLPREEQELKYYLAFILFVQYWLFREKIFGRLDPRPDPNKATATGHALDEQERILRISLTIEFSNFLYIFERTLPGHFAGVQKFCKIEEFMIGREVVGIAPPIIIAPPLDPASPSVQLWHAIEMANKQVAAQRGKPLLDENRQQVLQTYLTTQSSLADLRLLAGVTTKQGIQDQLRRSMSKIFAYLPEEVRLKYKTPEDALRERSAKPTELTIRKQKRGLDRLRRPDTGKREFSGKHKTNLSKAAARREQRKREIQQVPSASDQP